MTSQSDRILGKHIQTMKYWDDKYHYIMGKTGKGNVLMNSDSDVFRRKVENANN